MIDIAVIGGGAAGFFAAITAKRMQPQATVTIFEKSQRVLAKVGVSGGGRCNLTNTFAAIGALKQAYPRGEKLMKRLFKSFDHTDTYRWFEEQGVALTIQEDQCVFPRSQSSQSIIGCFLQQAKDLGIKIKTSHTLEHIKPLPDGRLSLSFKETTEPHIFHCAAVTTGGSARAEGLQYLADLGHEIVSPVPSLFTFNIADKAFCDLMGTVVSPVQMSIPGTKFRSDGALLITHWGASGPATLKLSSYAARHVAEQQYKFPIAVNWVNETDNESVQAELYRLTALHTQKKLTSIRPYDLPQRLWQFLLEKSALAADKKWGELGKKGINKLTNTLTNDVYAVSGKGVFREEFVTCGGVSLSSINLNTLESKTCPNLFFAGEVLDIDAITGGFNLQAAWTTGYTAGRAMSELKRHTDVQEK